MNYIDLYIEILQKRRSEGFLTLAELAKEIGINHITLQAFLKKSHKFNLVTLRRIREYVSKYQ